MRRFYNVLIIYDVRRHEICQDPHLLFVYEFVRQKYTMTPITPSHGTLLLNCHRRKKHQ